MKSHRFCAFLDVNFKGFNPGKEQAPTRDVAKFYREFLGGDKDEEHPVPAGRVVFLANIGLKPSLDLAEHGVFAQALLDGLKGAADKEGYGPDGYVTVDELVQYMSKEVPELVRKYGKTQEEKEQRDYVFGGRTSHYELTRNPAVAPMVAERLRKFEKLAAGPTSLRRHCRRGPDASPENAEARGAAIAAERVRKAGGWQQLVRRFHGRAHQDS